MVYAQSITHHCICYYALTLLYLRALHQASTYALFLSLDIFSFCSRVWQDLGIHSLLNDFGWLRNWICTDLIHGVNFRLLSGFFMLINVVFQVAELQYMLLCVTVLVSNLVVIIL